MIIAYWTLVAKLVAISFILRMFNQLIVVFHPHGNTSIGSLYHTPSNRRQGGISCWFKQIWPSVLWQPQYHIPDVTSFASILIRLYYIGKWWVVKVIIVDNYYNLYCSFFLRPHSLRGQTDIRISIRNQTFTFLLDEIIHPCPVFNFICG